MHFVAAVHLALAELEEAGEDPHDKGKQPFSASKTSNWVARAGGLPPYFQHVAHALQKKGLTESEAIHDAAVWGNANHAKSAEILLKYAKMDPDAAANMVRVKYGETLNPAWLQPVINVAAKYSKFPPFPAGDLIYKPAH